MMVFCEFCELFGLVCVCVCFVVGDVGEGE